jgi:hypothetical protein
VSIRVEIFFFESQAFLLLMCYYFVSGFFALLVNVAGFDMAILYGSTVSLVVDYSIELVTISSDGECRPVFVVLCYSDICSIHS